MTDGTLTMSLTVPAAHLTRGSGDGNDWAQPELWTRYAGHFSPYLQRRIDQLKLEMVKSRPQLRAGWSDVTSL